MSSPIIRITITEIPSMIFGERLLRLFSAREGACGQGHHIVGLQNAVGLIFEAERWKHGQKALAEEDSTSRPSIVCWTALTSGRESSSMRLSAYPKRSSFGT